MPSDRENFGDQSWPGPKQGQDAGRDGGKSALGPLPGYIGFNLRRTQAVMFRHLDHATRELDLTPGQFGLLTLLEVNPGISQKSVSRLFGVDTSTVSPVLESLVQRGLVSRSRAAHDRRSYALALSRQGTRALASMRVHVESQERLMADALYPGERDLLLDMLTRLTAALNSDD